MEQRRDYDGLLIVALLILMISTACDQSGSQAVFNSSDEEVGVEEVGVEEVGVESAAAKDASSVTTVEAANEPELPSDGSTQQPPSPPDELFQQAIGATVRLLGSASDAEDEFNGSGIILGQDADGFLYILTVWHAAKHNIDSVEVFSILSEDPIASLPNPELVSKRERCDLALLKVKATSDLAFECVKLIFSNDVSKTAQQTTPRFAYSVGCSDGNAPTLLAERITGSAKYKVENSIKNAVMWTTENPQTVGRSGGALLDVNGSLLGVALGYTHHEKNQGFYCHSSEISDYLIDNNLQTLVTCAKLEN